ncbi:MAG: hypothetical protein MUP97_15120 [Acidimicrobiia bacterium]|nr:hypothetical protein [Acidimicrobiia bacterium]
MRRIAPLFVTAALVLGVGAVAAPVGASTPAKTSAFCKALKNFNLPDVTGQNVSEETAAKAAKQLRKLSRKATGKLRQALKTLASGLEDVADGGKPEDLLTGDYIKAAGTFSLAAVKCLAGGIELPSN